MNTKKKVTKDFDAVKTARTIKEKISSEINGLTFEQFTKYLADRLKSAR